jgi:hypothetical protein
MFQPCILAIVRLYCKHIKQLYNMCVGYSGGKEISSVTLGGTRSLLTLVGGMVLDHCGPVFALWYESAEFMAQ